MVSDQNGDGEFETIITPTVSVTGVDAQDLTPPSVSINTTSQQSEPLLTITATDRESGILAIYYSVDGTRFQRYTKSTIIDTRQVAAVYAFADDNVANRSGIITYHLPNQPPDIGRARASVDNLWPANHELVSVTIQSVTDPEGDPVTITINRIMQDERTNDTGDGDTCPDAEGIGSALARLRAERSGKGNGRVYVIYFTADHGRGGVAQGSVKVGVPKTRDGMASNDGPTIASTACP